MSEVEFPAPVKVLFHGGEHGHAYTADQMRAYGNAINPHQAAEFVAAFMNADVRQELAAA